MILFLNTFITNQRFSGPEKRGAKSKDIRYSADRIEIFKYMLASLSVIEWEYAALYYELDEEYKNHYKDIDIYIRDLFNCDMEIYHYRNHRTC